MGFGDWFALLHILGGFSLQELELEFKKKERKERSQKLN